MGAAMNEPKYDWGETVGVSKDAPPKFRPGQVGEICGIREVADEIQSDATGERVGTVMYIVEFGDGSSVEIAEQSLLPEDSTG